MWCPGQVPGQLSAAAAEWLTGIAAVVADGAAEMHLLCCSGCGTIAATQHENVSETESTGIQYKSPLLIE